MTHSDQGDAMIPTLTLRSRRMKDHADLYLSGNHCWFVWDAEGTGGGNDAALVSGMRMIPIYVAMRDAEAAMVRHLAETRKAK